MYLLFKDRLEIEKQFLRWCKENNVSNQPQSVVAFIQSKGWLNEEKIKNELLS